MAILYKAKIHITDIAWNKNLWFAFSRALLIAIRRMRFLSKFFKHLPMRELHLMKAMKPRHNGCFIDVGACIGLWTFQLANKGKIVHAFEPFTYSYRFLREMAKQYSSVYVYPFALGEDNYIAQLHLHKTHMLNSITKYRDDYIGNEQQITVRKLDGFDIPDVGLIKIDVEGYEVPVLLGAKQTITKNRPRLVIEVHEPFKEQAKEVIMIIERLNYSWSIFFKKGRVHHIVCDPRNHNSLQHMEEQAEKEE